LLPEPDTPITMSAHGISSGWSATKILRKCGPIHQPDGLADRARAPRWQVLATEHARQDLALLRSGNFEQHLAAGRQHRQGQRYPRHERRDMRLRHADGPALGL